MLREGVSKIAKKVMTWLLDSPFFYFRKWESKSKTLHTFEVLKEAMFALWFMDPASAIEEAPTSHNSKPEKIYACIITSLQLATITVLLSIVKFA